MISPMDPHWPINALSAGSGSVAAVPTLEFLYAVQGSSRPIVLAGLGFLGGLIEIQMDDVGLQDIAIFEGLSEIPMDAVGLKDMLADVV